MTARIGSVRTASDLLCKQGVGGSNPIVSTYLPNEELRREQLIPKGRFEAKDSLDLLNLQVEVEAMSSATSPACTRPAMVEVGTRVVSTHGVPACTPGAAVTSRNGRQRLVMP